MLNVGITSRIGAPIIKQVLPPERAEWARPVPSAAEVSEAEKIRQPAETSAEHGDSIQWWSKDSFSFKDILDMLNPLQHLPVISTLYRALTGEKIGGVARIVGGAIWGRAGGIASMGSSLLNAVFGAVTGKDLGERIYAALFGDSKTPENATAIARAGAPERSPASGAPLVLAALNPTDGLTYGWTGAPKDRGVPAASGAESSRSAHDAVAAIEQYESRFGTRQWFED